jgi:hypothetical protein
MLKLSASVALLALTVSAHAAGYDPVDPQTWPDAPGYENVEIPEYRCNSDDQSECLKAYLYACQEQGKYQACDYYNSRYATTNEFISPNSPSNQQEETTAVPEANFDEQSRLAAACGNGDQAACTTLQTPTDEQLVVVACMQGDKAACEQKGLTPADPKAIAACADGNKASCEQLGIPYLDPQLADACAKGNQQVCIDIGIDPKQQELSNACAQGDQEACAAMGITPEMLQQQVFAQSLAEQDESKNGACEIVMCMASGMKQLPHQCVKGVQGFFSIRKTKHGHFSPDRTASARHDKIKKCDGASARDVHKIISAFGGLATNPFKFTSK